MRPFSAVGRRRSWSAARSDCRIPPRTTLAARLGMKRPPPMTPRTARAASCITAGASGSRCGWSSSLLPQRLPLSPNLGEECRECRPLERPMGRLACRDRLCPRAQPVACRRARHQGCRRHRWVSPTRWGRQCRECSRRMRQECVLPACRQCLLELPQWAQEARQARVPQCRPPVPECVRQCNRMRLRHPACRRSGCPQAGCRCPRRGRKSRPRSK
jgi:hypothetical protein